MKKQKVKKVPSVKELKKLLLTPSRDLRFLLHRIVSEIKRVNRYGKVDDARIYMLHQDIDFIIKD